MAAHADVPASAIAAVDAPMRRSLVVSASSYTPGLVTRDQTGDRGTAPYTARLTLSGLGAWSYTGSLTLVKTKDAAKHDRVAGAVHPGRDRTAADRRPHLRAYSRHRLPAAGCSTPSGLTLRGADGDLDSNLLGTVGPLTAAQAKAAGPGFVAGDIAGQTGHRAGLQHPARRRAGRRRSS